MGTEPMKLQNVCYFLPTEPPVSVGMHDSLKHRRSEARFLQRSTAGHETQAVNE